MDNDLEAQLVLIRQTQQNISCKKYFQIAMIVLLVLLGIFISVLFVFLYIRRV
jgi:uncharacterized membrane protein YukC